jgi:hypothetical protein
MDRPTDGITSARAALVCVLLGLLAGNAGCAPGEPDPAARPDGGAETTAEIAPQEAFWHALHSPCGRAHHGRLVVDRPDRDVLSGNEELIAHWVECDPGRIHIAFHIGRDGGSDEDDWDRSRTWVLTRDANGIELRHDHRLPDGSEEADTWYGGRTVDPGTASAQWFLFDERRAPDGSVLGWRIEIVPGERYTYGTIRGEDYTWRLDFDLSASVPSPPPAWGQGD